jgi:hypothetical protein
LAPGQATQNIVGGWGTGTGGGITYQPNIGATGPMQYPAMGMGQAGPRQYPAMGGMAPGQFSAMGMGAGYPQTFLPQPQYPVPGDRPTYTDYTNRQIIDSLRASKKWSTPGATEGTYREREGWTPQTDQQVLDYMAAQPASWMTEQLKDYRPAALVQQAEDISQRNEYQQRVQVGDYQSIANQNLINSMAMLRGYGQSGLREVEKNYLRNVGRGRAGLASRGMTGTTVYDAMQRGAGEQAMDDWLKVQDAITSQKINTYQQGMGQVLNAINSIQYQQMNPMEFANLYQAFGEGGAGAAAPTAPSTTTSALLGTAAGIATPLLLNSLFGPAGGAVSGLASGLGNVGTNVLGGIGDVVGGIWDVVEDVMPWNWFD